VLPWVVAAPLPYLAVASGMRAGMAPLGIGRITTAVGEAADARHADAITRAVGEVDGARVHAVSDRNLSFIRSPGCAAPTTALSRPLTSPAGVASRSCAG